MLPMCDKVKGSLTLVFGPFCSKPDFRHFDADRGRRSWRRRESKGGRMSDRQISQEGRWRKTENVQVIAV